MSGFCRIVIERRKLLTFDEYVRYIYGEPDEDDEFWDEYVNFGYDVWLINAYPDDWGIGCMADMWMREETDYNWYCVENILGIEVRNSLDALGSVLRKKPILAPQSDIICRNLMKIPRNSIGIFIGENELGILALFLDSENQLFPLVVDRDDVIFTGDVFDGFEDE